LPLHFLWPGGRGRAGPVPADGDTSPAKLPDLSVMTQAADLLRKFWCVIATPNLRNAQNLRNNCLSSRSDVTTGCTPASGTPTFSVAVLLRAAGGSAGRARPGSLRPARAGRTSPSRCRAARPGHWDWWDWHRFTERCARGLPRPAPGCGSRVPGSGLRTAGQLIPPRAAGHLNGAPPVVEALARRRADRDRPRRAARRGHCLPAGGQSQTAGGKPGTIPTQLPARGGAPGPACPERLDEHRPHEGHRPGSRRRSAGSWCAGPGDRAQRRRPAPAAPGRPSG
jgi:hypothetical protein